MPSLIVSSNSKGADERSKHTLPNSPRQEQTDDPTRGRAKPIPAKQDTPKLLRREKPTKLLLHNHNALEHDLTTKR